MLVSVWGCLYFFTQVIFETTKKKKKRGAMIPVCMCSFNRFLLCAYVFIPFIYFLYLFLKMDVSFFFNYLAYGIPPPPPPSGVCCVCCYVQFGLRVSRRRFVAMVLHGIFVGRSERVWKLNCLDSEAFWSFELFGVPNR